MMGAVRHVLHVISAPLILALALFASPVGLNAQQASQGELLFADDLHDAVIGEVPSKWKVNANYVSIVEDPGAVNGKAIQLLGDQQKASTISVQLSVNAPTLVVEYALRWVKNTGLNYYLDSTDVGSGQHNVNWYVGEGGMVGYRYTDSGRTVTASVGDLKDGWNRLRIVAHAARDEVYIYLNDYDKPALGPLPFRTPTQYWEDVNLILYDTGRRDDLAESYYDDVRVWRVTDN